jgi:hypothetical protein
MVSLSGMQAGRAVASLVLKGVNSTRNLEAFAEVAYANGVSSQVETKGIVLEPQALFERRA